ncbi:MAG: DNA-binding NtrC family response regulator, partial [Kiritimatiellia bacterium]
MRSTILLIDDDPIDIQALRLLLESWGHDVHCVRSGADGLKALESTNFDLVVTDVNMPEMSGQDVVRHLSDASPELPVILITAFADIRVAVDAMKLGAFDYIVKPPNEDELRLTIDRALRHAGLRRENAFLRAELAAGGMYGERLMGQCDAMQHMFALMDRVAPTDSTVLITGETGTGKELVAQTIHYKSRRADKPLIAMNCAAINPNLIESELFGHEKGAYTGATTARRGRFEDADGGSLFLDEIGEMPLDLQAKLLRALQEQEIERVGGNTTVSVDVRVLASTHRNLENDVSEGLFREDLFYRLNVIPVHLPALRERGGDILLLATHFLTAHVKRYGGPAESFSKAARAYLSAQSWKGNVRELSHCIERAVVLARQPMLEVDDLKPLQKGAEATSSGSNADQTLRAALDARSREHLINVLERTDWQKQKAAEILDVDRATL